MRKKKKIGFGHEKLITGGDIVLAVKQATIKS